MSDDMFLRLRLPAGVTLATAAPEVREAVRVLVDCKAAALYRGDVSGLTPDSGDVRGAFAAAGKTLAAVGVPEDGEEARAALLQLVNRVDQLEHDEVVVKLARDYWPVISAMFVTDPRRAVSICKLFYWIKKKGSMSHEVDSLLHKNLSLDQAVVTLALMLELDNDTVCCCFGLCF